MASHREFDPLYLPILLGRLRAVADEAATTLVRTAFSTILHEANDYACMLLDHTGQTVVENTWAIPAFICCAPQTVGHMLRRFPAASWQPGDVVITNDPWIGSGHLPDFTVVSPVFHGDRHVGFAATVAHHVDVGGVLSSAETGEIFEEGLRIPISRLYRAGRLNDELLDVIRANVRLPEQLVGDLQAQIAANRTIIDRTGELLASERLGDLASLAAAMQSQAEGAMRRAIDGIPDGAYRSRRELDGFDHPLVLDLELTVRGSEMRLDYAGTSPQQPRALNVPFTITNAHSAYAIKCLLDPDTPRNEGSYRPITVSAPVGSLLNPVFPAAVNARHLTFLYISPLIFEALAPAIPDRVIAESGTPFMHVVYSGTDDRGVPFIHVSFDSAGMGARPNKDGLSATPFPNNTGGAPVELVEAATPLLFHEKRLVPDSGGLGRFRGGLGTQLVVEALCTSPVLVSVMGDRTRNAPRGLFGGRGGSCASVLRNGEPVSPKARTILRAGDRLLIRNAGGGGYGPASARDPAEAQRDLEYGYVTHAGRPSDE